MPDVRKLLTIPLDDPSLEAPPPRLLSRRGKYKLYIESEDWARLRRQRFEIDRHECRTCGSKQQLEVHHVRYPTMLGHENVGLDLITLCHLCHEAISRRLGQCR